MFALFVTSFAKCRDERDYLLSTTALTLHCFPSSSLHALMVQQYAPLVLVLVLNVLVYFVVGLRFGRSNAKVRDSHIPSGIEVVPNDSWYRASFYLSDQEPLWSSTSDVFTRWRTWVEGQEQDQDQGQGQRGPNVRHSLGDAASIKVYGTQHIDRESQLLDFRDDEVWVWLSKYWLMKATS